MSSIRHLVPKASTLLLRCALPLFVATTLALTGCSSVKMHVDHGPVSAKSFSFVQPNPGALPNYATERKEVHTLIQEAITKNLAAKGVSQVAQGGDVIIAYLVIAGNNATTTAFSSYFGNSPDTAALLDKVHAQQTSGDASRNYFEEGTLVIDVVDPQTSKTLQRRSIQGQVLRDLAPETRAERIQAVVDQALANLSLSH